MRRQALPCRICGKENGSAQGKAVPCFEMPGLCMDCAKFEAIYHPDGTCQRWDCGQPGVVLAYDDFTPEVALWFCAEHWQPYEESNLLTVVKDTRIKEVGMNWTLLSAEQKDALIAEKVMGWKPAPCDSDLLEGCGFWRCERCGLEGDWDHFDDYMNHIALPPHYSTDLNAAWQVVERITRPPATLVEATRAANTRFGFWFDREHLWACSAQEAADAICKNALIAVGVEIE